MNRNKLLTLHILRAAFLLCFSMTLHTQAAPASLDTTFGNSGKVITELPPHKNYARRVRIQTDGKIVTVGHSWGLGPFPFALEGSFITRHQANGALDTSFGVNGVVNTERVLNDFVILPDGKLLAVGYNASRFALYRYNNDGTVDSGFGANGTITTQVGADGSAARRIVLQPDGKFVVFGFSYEVAFRGNLAVVRYHADGLLDNSFGPNGILLTSIEPYTFYEIIGSDTIVDYFGDAVMQPDGKLLVCVSNYTNYAILLVRLNANGTLDQTFGANGGVYTNFLGY